VSHLNYADEVRSTLKLPEKVEIHDVTLRDGEQQSGIVFRKEDKIEIAKMLDEVGIRRIEAGMPTVSSEDFEAVKSIAHEGLTAKVFSFSRCMRVDVDNALKCGVDGIVMEIPSSEHLIKYGYGWPLEKALQLPIDTTNYAKDHGLYVDFFTIDGSRADMNWWLDIISKVSSEGHMDSLTVVDTFGVCTPEAIRFLVRKVKERIKDKPVEAHFHNDFGLGIANTLAAVTEGVKIVHATVNGIGERMGNADFIPMALALESLYGVKLDLKYEKLYELSKLVERLSGVKVPPQYPVVGENIYNIESGIVVGWLKEAKKHDKPLVLLPYHWEFLGRNEPSVVLGKKSGKPNIEHKLEEYKLDVPPESIDSLLQEVKNKSISLKRPLNENEFKEIVKNKMRH